MTNTTQKKQLVLPGYSFGNVVDNIFNNTMRRFLDGNLWDTDTPGNKGTVPVNVRETEKHYEVDVIAPGCSKEDFRLQVEDKELTISFTKNDQKREESENAGWARYEYIQRSFSRSFTLDETIDTGNIQASYKDGILNVILPKNEKAKPNSRLIEVN
jgi:HSP20 family protein